MTQTSSERVPAYTQDHPAVPNIEDLRVRIPGWGADLNKEDRPSVPKLQFIENGAHWDFPERQPEKWPRERSVEHRFLTPVFGTAQPLSGLSGAMRRYAYKFSEGRAAHWMILLYADRVDAGEQHLRDSRSRRVEFVPRRGELLQLRALGLSGRAQLHLVDLVADCATGFSIRCRPMANPSGPESTFAS